MQQENIAESTELFYEVEEGVFALSQSNEENDYKQVTKTLGQHFIQFHFCDRGEVTLFFNQGNYSLSLKKMQSLLLYNPKEVLGLYLKIAPQSHIFSLFITIDKFHSLFSQSFKVIDFLSPEAKNEKYYAMGNLSPQLAVILHQIRTTYLHTSVYSLYLKAKIYELLSIFFNKSQGNDNESCPFLSNEENIRKIRKAKEIIVKRMVSPPSLQELSDEVGLPLKRLKTGFKKVYGESVYNFLFDYKMEQARKWLQSGEVNVNELSSQLGYSISSHFIAAFKKKFGTTPKKYLITKKIT